MSNIMDVIGKGEIYLTFVFDGMDSTQMGIASVSSGGTYNIPILPTFNDNFLDVDGYNGRYYFNTRTSSKEFTFTCFIDNLSAFEFDSIRAWLRPDKIGKLIVPETPYQYHWVKVTSIDSLGNIPLTHPDTGGVSYTGTFNITFSTIGPATGYGMFYYADDLQYYEYRDIFDGTQNYMYDSGLLYKEESLPLSYTLTTGNYSFGIYNPGTCSTKMLVKIKAKANIGTGLVSITNKTTGDVSIITLKDISNGSVLSVDYAKNEYLLNGADASKLVMGDLIHLSPREYVERIDSVAISNNGNNTRIKFDKMIRQVRNDDIGKTVMFKDILASTASDGVGGIIMSIDRDDNAFILAPNAGLWTNPNVNVIITKVDDLSTEVNLPNGVSIELNYEIQPRYI